jgi:TonB family protein
LATEVTASVGAPVDDTAALITWRSRLAAHVQRFKRYPAEAIERHLFGTALVRFTIDRARAVLSTELVGHSGIDVLDRESLSLIAQAAPCRSRLEACSAPISPSRFRSAFIRNGDWRGRPRRAYVPSNTPWL